MVDAPHFDLALLTGGDEETVTVDVNVSIGHYPFRHLPFDSRDPQTIKDKLQACGIQRACTGSLDAVFYADPAQGNEALLPQLVDDAFFMPVGVVSPLLQNWRETLQRSVEEYGCRMVRLYPSYHGYRLIDRCVEEFLHAATELNVLVAIVQRIEDERMHHLLMKVPATEAVDVMGTAQRFQQPLVMLNATWREIAQIGPIAEDLYFDIAFAETMNTLTALTQSVAAERLLLGSNTPLLYPEAAVGKIMMWEAADREQALVAGANAAKLLGL